MRGLLTNRAHAALHARHVASVSSSALARLQLARLADARPGIALHVSGVEAMAWIDRERGREPVRG